MSKVEVDLNLFFFFLELKLFPSVALWLFRNDDLPKYLFSQTKPGAYYGLPITMSRMMFNNSEYHRIIWIVDN